MSNEALKILVIEDEPDLALTLSYNLQKAGYEVATELTGGGGLVKAETFEPNLVLLDLMLPDTSGFEVCRALKQFCYPVSSRDYVNCSRRRNRQN